VPENIQENQKLIGKYLEFLEYPDGTVAIMHEGRKINYSMKNWNSKTNVIVLKRCQADVHRKQQFNNEI
jgi:hypothetical protein